MDWGASVYAKLVATNSKGTSNESNEGNGAVIITRPDAPSNLLEDSQYRTASTLGLTWTPGAENGATIIDYRIS